MRVGITCPSILWGGGAGESELTVRYWGRCRVSGATHPHSAVRRFELTQIIGPKFVRLHHARRREMITRLGFEPQ